MKGKVTKVTADSLDCAMEQVINEIEYSNRGGCCEAKGRYRIGEVGVLVFVDYTPSGNSGVLMIAGYEDTFLVLVAPSSDKGKWDFGKIFAQLSEAGFFASDGSVQDLTFIAEGEVIKARIKYRWDLPYYNDASREVILPLEIPEKPFRA